MSFQAVFANDDSLDLMKRIQEGCSESKVRISQICSKPDSSRVDDKPEWIAIEDKSAGLSLETLSKFICGDLISIHFYDEHITEFFYIHYHKGNLSRSLAIRAENLSEIVNRSNLFGAQESWEADSLNIGPYEAFKSVVNYYKLPISPEQETIKSAINIILVNPISAASIWQTIRSLFS